MDEHRVQEFSWLNCNRESNHAVLGSGAVLDWIACWLQDGRLHGNWNLPMIVDKSFRSSELLSFPTPLDKFAKRVPRLSPLLWPKIARPRFAKAQDGSRFR